MVAEKQSIFTMGGWVAGLVKQYSQSGPQGLSVAKKVCTQLSAFFPSAFIPLAFMFSAFSLMYCVLYTTWRQPVQSFKFFEDQPTTTEGIDAYSRSIKIPQNTHLE